MAAPPLFGQHQESNRLHSWALNRIQCRQKIYEDIRQQNIQILQQNSLQLKFEITVRLNNIVQRPFPLSPPSITAQSLPRPFITTEVLINTTDTQFLTIHTQDYHTHVNFKDVYISTNPFSDFHRTKYKSISSHRTSRFTNNTL